MVLPTSVHGGVQLWYGTLQVGPYLHSRALQPALGVRGAGVRVHQPRRRPDRRRRPGQLRRRKRSPTSRWRTGPISIANGPTRSRRRASKARDYTFEIPAAGPRGGHLLLLRHHAGPAVTDRVVRTTPRRRRRAPFVYFVSSRHLADLDVHGDLLDVFDVVRLMRHAAWNGAGAVRRTAPRRRRDRSPAARPLLLLPRGRPTHVGPCSPASQSGDDDVRTGVCRRFDVTFRATGRDASPTWRSRKAWPPTLMTSRHRVRALEATPTRTGRRRRGRAPRSETWRSTRCSTGRSRT